MQILQVCCANPALVLLILTAYSVIQQHTDSDKLNCSYSKEHENGYLQKSILLPQTSFSLVASDQSSRPSPCDNSDGFFAQLGARGSEHWTI